MDSHFRQIACVLINHLAIKVEENKNPDLIDEDVIIYVNDRHGKTTVFDYSSSIRNIFIGMDLSQALSICPEAITLEADFNEYNKLFDAVLLKLSKKVERIENVSLGKAYFDLTGYAESFGGESRLIANILDAIPSFFGSRLGISDNKFFAYCAAILSDSGRAMKVTEENINCIYKLPIKTLINDSELLRDLNLFGISTIGKFLTLSKNAISSRFGFDGIKAWDIVNGAGFDPVRLNRLNDNVSEQTCFPYESSSQEMFYAVLDSLVEKLYASPVVRGRYISTFRISCEIPEYATWEKEIVLTPPSNNAIAAVAALRRNLGDISLPGLVERMIVTASGLVGEHGIQSEAFLDINEEENGKNNRHLIAEQYLENKLNSYQDVCKIVDVNHKHPLPEMRFIQIPINPYSKHIVKAMNIPKLINVKEIAGTPVCLVISSRKKVNVSVHDEWKVDLWWMRNPAIRSYYRLTTEEGVCMTVFKDMKENRWYIQHY